MWERSRTLKPRVAQQLQSRDCAASSCACTRLKAPAQEEGSVELLRQSQSEAPMLGQDGNTGHALDQSKLDKALAVYGSNINFAACDFHKCRPLGAGAGQTALDVGYLDVNATVRQELCTTC